MYREYVGDGGINLQIEKSVMVKPGMNIIELEEVDFSDMRHQAIVIPRSKTFTLGLLVPTTLIDTGFKGHPMLQVFNMTQHPVRLSAGDAIVQMVLMQVLVPMWSEPVKGERK